MSTESIVSIILGTVGTLTGCIGAWLAIKATRQKLTITRTDNKQLKFAVVNYTLRPIPIQAIELTHEQDGKIVKVGSTPTLSGLLLPGILPPEARMDIEWNGADQLFDVVWHESFTLTVEMQTGKKVSLTKSAKTGLLARR